MAEIKQDARQTPKVAIADFTYADFVSGTGKAAVRLPANAIVIGGYLAISTAFNSGTSDTMTVGDATTANRYKAGINAQTAALTALVPTGFKLTAAGDVLITNTAVGTAISAGAGRLVIQYIVTTRAESTQD